jgi:hypothetical protein
MGPFNEFKPRVFDLVFRDEQLRKEVAEIVRTSMMEFHNDRLFEANEEGIEKLPEYMWQFTADDIATYLVCACGHHDPRLVGVDCGGRDIYQTTDQFKDLKALFEKVEKDDFDPTGG